MRMADVLFSLRLQRLARVVRNGFCAELCRNRCAGEQLAWGCFDPVPERSIIIVGKGHPGGSRRGCPGGGKNLADPYF